MLILVHGTDNPIVRRSANMRVEGLRKKRPGAQFFDIHGDDLSESALDELTGGRGLFDDKYIVRLNGSLQGQNADLIRDKLEQISLSENAFILIEGALSAKDLKAMTKHATKIDRFDLPDSGGSKFSSPALFAVGNAFVAGDMKGAWIQYVKLIDKGEPVQPIVGALSGSIRRLIKCKQGESGGYRDTANAKKFTLEQLEDFSRDLVCMYHEERMSGADLNLSFEKFLLNATTSSR